MSTDLITEQRRLAYLLEWLRPLRHKRCYCPDCIDIRMAQVILRR